MPRAARVAALIEERLHQQADLEPGDRGEFTVRVDGTVVAEKSGKGFPADPAIIEAVRHGLE